MDTKRIYNRKNIFIHPDVTILGIENITVKKRVLVGLRTVDFALPSEKTFLNIAGKLHFKGNYSIGKGCRIDVRKGGTLEIGKGGYINSFSRIIVAHKVVIGDECAISWDCQFLDEDFHSITYTNKAKRVEDKSKNAIVIGNHVWMGCNVKIYKGSRIAEGCVIASDSIVKGIFKQKNCLIGGNPARVLKENIDWK